MTYPSVPEADRLAALQALEILDTPDDAHFDAVCRTAKALFSVPACGVSLVDADRHWFKASCGLDLRESDRSTSFCTHAIAADDVFVVEDAQRDARFADNPWVVGAASLRFYAGAPLELDPGIRVGTLCLADVRPRRFGAEERAQLADLATIVVAHLRLQREIVARRQQQDEDARRTAALREANHLLTLAEQVGEVGHWRVRLADRSREWSPEMYRIRGLPPGSTPPPLDDVGAGYHPEDRARVHAAVEAASRDGRDFTLEARVLRTDGEVRDVLIRGICEKDGHGVPTALFGVIIDLTDHKRMEAILATSAARYDALADALPQIVWMMRVNDGQATYVNSQFERYYGPIGPERAARVACNHPDDATRMERAWQRARQAGDPFEIEARIRRADGAYRWHKLVMIPIRKDGEIAEWLGTALDVDDIVTARSELEETSDLLRLAQEAADVGPWSWDLGTGLMRLSPDSAALHGLSEATGAEMPTADWTACVHPDDRAHVWQNVRIAVEAGSSLAAEYRVVGIENARWIRVQGRVVYNGEGLPSRMVGLHFDISTRKAVETALAEAKAKAEVAQHIAEEANAAKSDFLATMSHEIRTPLNGVIGYADVLAQEGPLTPRQRVHVERVRSAGAALLTVVNDILDFSRIEAGQIEIDPCPFSFATLVDAAVAIVRPEAERKGLTLRARIGETTPLFLAGDEGRLRQVLLNLLSNAVKFTPRGGVSLTVDHEGEDAEGARLRVAVTDTGIGIPQDKRDRLFSRFSQIDGSIQRRYGGTGLGLAISKQLIELMGGAIGVESREGAGSTFWFTVTLPRAEAAVETERRQAAPDAAAARLLLVEDVPTNQELARTILQAAGYAVDVAGNGAEAVAAVEAFAYDLVLMDVQMPVMDGITAARAIRALDDPSRRAVPIIAMTANVMPQQVAECRPAGMADCIGKPYRRDELYAAIERALPLPTEAAATDPARAPGLALDEDVYDTMREVMGTERIGELLADLARELRTHFDGTPVAPDREKLSFSAHAMASATGMLGFTGFSLLCREVEQACATDADLAPLVGRLAEAQAATLERIATLIAA